MAPDGRASLARLAVLVVAALGVWFWYAWFGSVPRTVWSVRFAEPSYSGQSAFCGKDQIVFSTETRWRGTT